MKKPVDKINFNCSLTYDEDEDVYYYFKWILFLLNCGIHYKCLYKCNRYYILCVLYNFMNLELFYRYIGIPRKPLSFLSNITYLIIIIILVCLQWFSRYIVENTAIMIAFN